MRTPVNMARHAEVARSCGASDLAVTATGHVLRLEDSGLWRVDSDGEKRVGGIAIGCEIDVSDVVARLGGLTRKGDEAQADAPAGAMKCSDTREDAFMRGQHVSFYALDGTLAVARFDSASKTGLGVGSLEVWGRRRHSAIYGEAGARSYFSSLQTVFSSPR